MGRKRNPESVEAEDIKAKQHGGKRIGAGVPAGNNNAKKHGAYSEVWLNLLDNEEREVVENMPLDEETLFERQIKLYEVRELRFMKAIKHYREMPGDCSFEREIKTEVKRDFKNEAEKMDYEKRIQERVENGERLPGESYNLQTESESKINIITRLEKELTAVQSKKEQSINDLAKLRQEKRKMSGEAEQMEIAQRWAEGIVALRGNKK